MDATSPSPRERLRSIDALRGFDMFWIIGGDALFKAFDKWPPAHDVFVAIGQWLHIPGNNWVSEQLTHVEWEGFRFYDLIFPLFLFLVGVVIPFSRSSDQGGGSHRAAYWRIARRVALLFALGLLGNRIFDLDWPNLRIAGVLQRIAICYGVAALIALHTGWRAQAAIVAGILLGYWAVLHFVAAPGGVAGDLSMEHNLAGWIDRQYLPGAIKKEYYGYGDNEGLLSTVPAIATALIGVLAGHWLRSMQSPLTKTVGLAAAGATLLAAGWAWSHVFPIIKILWTSSYVLVAGGFSLLLLALFYGIIDGLRWQAWAFFFVVIGANAIVIYVVPRFVDFGAMSRFFLKGAAQHAEPELGPVILICGKLALEWLFLLYLYRNKLFLRV
jgi:predicted acyltransferase